MASTRQQIIDLHEAWINVELAGRARDLAAMCDKEIVIAPPGVQPVVGLAAACDFLDANTGPIAELRIESMEIEVFGELATKRARFVTRVEGAMEPVSGWHLWVLRPAWRIAYMTWSLDDFGAT